MKEEDYIIKLKHEVHSNKKICLDKIRSLHGEPTQQLQRFLSWAYSFRHGQVTKDHLNLEFPLPIANSDSDIYHQNHLIRAVLLCIYYPEELPVQTPALAKPIVCLAKNEIQRWENLALTYHALVPSTDYEPTIKPSSKVNWQNEILNLEQETNLLVRAIHGSIFPSDKPADKNLDKKPNRSRKLSSKK